MKNKVIAGDYEGKPIITNGPYLQIVIGFMKTVDINNDTVENYDVITEDKRKSGTSAVLRGTAGAVVLGPVGMLAGLSAKNKGTYQVKINFKDGKKALIEIDDKTYKKLIKTCL